MERHEEFRGTAAREHTQYDPDAIQTDVRQNLTQAGFDAAATGQIVELVQTIMSGRLPLANVLVAATEASKLCGLVCTHRYVAEAVECLAAEV